MKNVKELENVYSYVSLYNTCMYTLKSFTLSIPLVFNTRFIMV